MLLGLSLLSGCAAMGLPAVEALTVGVAVGATAAVVANEDEKERTKVYGTYRDGFWFDRELYSVWVVADNSEEAERVARSTAVDSCLQRGKFLTIIESRAWQERRLFIPVKIDRFSFEMRFRCRSDVVENK